MTQNAVARQHALVEQPQQEPVSETAAILQVIERAARDPSVDIDKLDRLLAMRERMEARVAERAFDTAMAEAQNEMRPVRADASNPQTRSRYASFAALDKALRDTYTSHGFSLSFNTEPSGQEQVVRVVCRVAHRDGHARAYHVDMPADGKGAKGGDVMTKTHATGAAITYGMRYLLKMIFNIAVGEDDDDGNAAGNHGEKITEEQAASIRGAAEEVGADIAKLCAYFRVTSIPDIPAAKYKDVMAALAKKRKASK